MKNLIESEPGKVMGLTNKLLGLAIALTLIGGCASPDDTGGDTVDTPLSSLPLAAPASGNDCALDANLSDDTDFSSVVVCPYNITCEDLGFSVGIKIETDNAGDTDTGAPEYPQTVTREIAIGDDYYPFTVTLTINADGTIADWSIDEAEDYSIAAVILKGGPKGSRVYFYDNYLGTVSDGNDLTPPPNKRGNIPAISHISFCFVLNLHIDKTADAQMRRTFSWDIDKTVDENELTLGEGDTANAEYTVTITPGPSQDEWAGVTGTVTVTNPWPQTATVTDVEDALNTPETHQLTEMDCIRNDTDTTARLDFVSETGAIDLGEYDRLACQYKITFAPTVIDTDATNTANVITAPASPVKNATVTVPVSFDTPTFEYARDCASVTDIMATAGIGIDTDYLVLSPAVCQCTQTPGILSGYDCVPETAFMYDRTFVGAPCGETSYQALNTATLTALDDTEYTLTDTAGVTVNSLACPSDTDTGTDADTDVDTEIDTDSATDTDADGCTLTQGYWKTHSQAGPSHYDDTWDLVVGETASPPQVCPGAVYPEDRLFFCSGLSWIDTLMAPPGDTDKYLILAHQWIAAFLNMLNGADVPEHIQGAIDRGTELLSTPCLSTPACESAAYTFTDEELAEMLSLACTLDAYNNGLYGGTHCGHIEPNPETLPPDICIPRPDY